MDQYRENTLWVQYQVPKKTGLSGVPCYIVFCYRGSDHGSSTRTTAYIPADNSCLDRDRIIYNSGFD